MQTELNPPRANSKEARLVDALSGNGKTIKQLSALLGWKTHTVRAAFTRLRARGYKIERVPKTDKTAAKFRLSEAK